MNDVVAQEKKENFQQIAETAANRLAGLDLAGERDKKEKHDQRDQRLDHHELRQLNPANHRKLDFTAKRKLEYVTVVHVFEKF